MTAQIMQIGNRPCRIYGEAHAEYLLLQMTGEHELQSMESEVTVIAQSAHRFLFAAIPVESWNDALSPWMESETFRLQVHVRFVFLRFVASSFVEKLSHLLQILPCSSW